MHAALFIDHDVFRLHVPIDHRRMRGVQTGEHLAQADAQITCLPHRQRAVPMQDVCQRLSLHPVHHDDAAILTDELLPDARQRGMIDPAHQLRFPLHILFADPEAPHLRTSDPFESDLLLRLQLLCQVDRRHAALADPPAYPVSAIDDLLLHKLSSPAYIRPFKQKTKLQSAKRKGTIRRLCQMIRKTDAMIQTAEGRNKRSMP